MCAWAGEGCGAGTAVRLMGRRPGTSLSRPFRRQAGEGGRTLTAGWLSSGGGQLGGVRAEFVRDEGDLVGLGLTKV